MKFLYLAIFKIGLVMRVLFLTDSLGYPRVDGAGTSASDVWTYYVRDRLNDCSNKFTFFFDMRPFRDTTSLLLDVRNHCLSYFPDVIVLQVGIVDCYPRSLKKAEFQILTRIPLLNRLTKLIVKRFYKSIVKNRNIAYVSLVDFEKNLKCLKELFGASKFIVLPIGEPCSKYRQKNPLIEYRVKKYNAIQKKLFGEDYKEDLYKECDLERAYLADHHHLSKYGHQHVASRILSYFAQFEKRDNSE